MDKRALGEVPVADFAAAGTAVGLHLPDAVGREVVVQHEPLEGRALEGLHLLRIGLGAQGHDGERLGLAALEDRTAVDAGQDAGHGGQRPHLVGGAAVRPLPVVNDHVAHRLPLGLGQQVLDRLFLVGELCDEGLDDVGLGRLGAFLAGQLVGV